jgi:hypothetical protein
MNKRQAMKEAHGQAGEAIRQYADQQGGLLGDDEAEDEAIRSALYELADRHNKAARVTGSKPPGGEADV